jgi:hypothetical protein
MRVPQGEYRTAVYPDETELETLGLGPCIGLAIISEHRGFLLHSPDVIVEAEDTMIPFFRDVERFIPRALRSTIKPLFAGGLLDSDEQLREATYACRYTLRERLRGLGFGAPRMFWAQPDESHSIRLDLLKQEAELERYILPTRETLETLNIRF